MINPRCITKKLRVEERRRERLPCTSNSLLRHRNSLALTSPARAAALPSLPSKPIPNTKNYN